jgi:hypothetical protein
VLTGAVPVASLTGDAALPDADPLHTDLYVQVSVSNGTEPFTETELADLREAWASMPVDNPDGSTGIDLHVDQRRLNRTLVIDGAGDYDRLKSRYTSADTLGNRSGVYRHLLLLEIERDYAGRAVHELLHNVVGRLDGANQCPDEFDGQSATYHTCQGWLSHDRPGQVQFRSDGVAAERDRDGLLPA